MTENQKLARGRNHCRNTSRRHKTSPANWGPNFLYNRICPTCFARVLVGPFTGVIDIAECLKCEGAHVKKRAAMLAQKIEDNRRRRTSRFQPKKLKVAP